MYSSCTERAVDFSEIKKRSANATAWLNQKLEQEKQTLTETSRTAQLSVHYMEYAKVIKMFIFAERIGDSESHLDATRRMLNLFAAADHYNYAKCGRMYLQQMLELPSNYPRLYKSFKENGYHIIRRSNQYWTGLWSDLVIEPVMMMLIKSRGGLTRGRGMTESVRHQWVYTNHACAAIHDAMTKITNLSLLSSEQHLKMGKTRKERDYKDLLTRYNWLSTHSAFDAADDRLRSISSGITVPHNNCLINCDNTERIGEAIQMGLDGTFLHTAKNKSKSKIQQIDSLYNTVVIKEGKYINLKPTSRFTRLTALAQREDDVEKLFKYEMTTIPMSLFKHGMMRKPDKVALRNHLITAQGELKKTCKQVLDSGVLIHKVQWGKDVTFRQLCKQYVNLVRSKFDQCSVVFDGYEAGPNTKDHEHCRRTVKNRGAVEFISNEETKVKANQEAFLSNEKNKVRFLKILSEFLIAHRQTVRNYKEDADTEIVTCVIDFAEHCDVSVVSDDTDVALLLLFHWKPLLHEITFTSEKKSWTIRDAVST